MFGRLMWKNKDVKDAMKIRITAIYAIRMQANASTLKFIFTYNLNCTGFFDWPLKWFKYFL